MLSLVVIAIGGDCSILNLCWFRKTSWAWVQYKWNIPQCHYTISSTCSTACLLYHLCHRKSTPPL